jgi:hypothetical protein
MKPCPLFDGRFLAAESGEVFSVAANRFLKSGTTRLDFEIKGKRVRVSRAKVILEAFGFPLPGKNFVAKYKDGNQKNFSIENLEWQTFAEAGAKEIRKYHTEEELLEARREQRRKAKKKRGQSYKTAQNARREAAKQKRTPPWYDSKKVLVKYKEAAVMTKVTGVKHEVDHFFPLRGELVSGLHVAANLHVIPARENNLKNNKMPTVIGPIL